MHDCHVPSAMQQANTHLAAPCLLARCASRMYKQLPEASKATPTTVAPLLVPTRATRRLAEFRDSAIIMSGKFQCEK